jgi:TP901 family phage tail tape measure protein
VAESRLDILIRLKDQITQGLRNIKKGFNDVEKSAESVTDVDTSKSQKSFQDFEKEIEATKTASERLTSQLSVVRNAGLAIAGIGAAIAAPFLIGARATAQFSTQIAEVATLVPEAVQSTEQLRRTVVDLSSEFGADRADVARGLYQAISSGATAGAEANEILRVALVTARGGVTSTTAAVNGLSTVLNSFGLQASDAEKVADALFVTVKNGRTTIDELSRFLFQAAPVASQLGISYQELNAALVTLTKQGVPTRVAFTQIRAAINGLVRDTPELTKAFEKYGGAQKVIAEQGLAKALEIARDAADGNVGTLNKLLGSIEGVGAVLGLTGDQLDEFIDQLRQQEEASGDAAAAAEKVGEAFGVTTQEAIQAVSNLLEELGTTVEPILQPLVAVVRDIAEGLRALIQDNPLARFIAGFVAAIGVALTAIGSLIAVLAQVGIGLVIARTALSIASQRMAQFATSSGAAAVAVRGFGVALRFAVPIIGIITGVLALFAGAAAAAEIETDKLVDTTDQLRASFNNLDNEKAARAIAEQEQNVRNLERALRDAKAEQEKEAKGGFFGVDEEDLAVATESVTDLEAQLKNAREVLGEFREDFENVSAAEINPEKLQEFEDAAADAKEKFEELRQAAKDAQADLDSIVVPEPEFLTVEGGTFIVNEQQIKNAEALRVEAERKRDVAVEDAIFAQQASEAADRELQATREAADELNAKAKEEQRIKDLIEARLALAERELAATERAVKLAESRAKAEEKVRRARQRLAELQDTVALEEGEIDEAEFEERARARIEAQLKASESAATEALERARQRTAAKIEELRAEAAADTTVDNTEAIRNLEATLQGVEAATEAAIEEAGINAQIAGIELGRDLAEGIVEGFEQSATGIGTRLQSTLISLQAELDRGAISQQVFADKVQQANDIAAASYDALRESLVSALEGADEADRAAIIALIQQIDAETKRLTNTISVFEQRLATAVEGELATFFETIITDIDDVNEAFTQLFINIGEQVKKLIAQKLADKLTKSLFGEGSVLGGFLGGSEGGSVQLAKGGYVKAAKGGYVSRRMPQTRRDALYAAAGGIVAVDNVRAAQRSTVALMAKGGRYDDDEELRRRRSARWGGFVRAATGGSIAANPLNWSSGAPQSPVSDDLEEARQRVVYKARRGGGILKLTDGGGRVRGPGTKTSDSVPAMLSNGEYVVKAASVDRYGLQFLEALNRGMLSRRDTKQAAPRRKLSVTKPVRQKFAEGGLVFSGPSAGGVGGANVGIDNAVQSGANTMKLEVNEATLNLTMRDFLEREFASILATR